ncbi:MAG: hypothetical protein QOE36_3602 [Gaiellaceae bacterium]|nr:hypothetical protein [Gaiellaceae bacterium]
MADRHFTADEANALLERVRPLAEQMVEQHRLLAGLLGRRSGATATIASNGGGANASAATGLDAEVAAAREELARCVRELHELGVQVKDLASGLLDFPALREGEEVLLCWRVGEDEIRYWHGADEGFAGRKPLPL